MKSCIGDFLKTLQDPDLNVRRVALVTFNSAAHNKPSLIRDLLESVLPHLYNETKVRVSKLQYCFVYIQPKLSNISKSSRNDHKTLRSLLTYTMNCLHCQLGTFRKWLLDRNITDEYLSIDSDLDNELTNFINLYSCPKMTV